MDFSLTDDNDTIAKKNALKGLSLGVTNQPADVNAPNLGVSDFSDMAIADPHPANVPSAFDPLSNPTASAMPKAPDVKAGASVDTSKGNPFFYTAPEDNNDDKMKQLGQFASLAAMFG